ncbi:glycosyltransferase family 2 protein [uncultured Algimonas sp.]|uniref:glycosyltransferase family 2 protein n=1 Tax=uncultured Algimonas sp. TaxID=1547920 RepID=UPI0026395C97|nr:glycosyltransferase family 2 protein [uncultured Algimonas sp.]
MALLFGAGVTTQFSIGTFLLNLTVMVAWVSVALGGLRLLACMTPPRHSPALLPRDRLPRYTVILPLFHEAHMVAGLIRSLSALDYPPDRLDIILVCESDDPDTVSAAEALAKPPFRVLVVPPTVPGGPPQTKPRALNYALERSSGTLVTIYDAEDCPHSQQLRQAASAFAAHPDWAALQAPLDYFNTRDCWLAAQFGLEYAGLFHVMLPLFDRLGLPFPLGGTSNHMRRDALEQAGGWDPHNVTEDADLAFRLSAQGGTVGWIDLPTGEEAVSRLHPWFKQRSRWLKGYIQTWMVHMNAPVTGGWRRALMLQLTLGLSLLSVAFFAPVMLGLGLLGLAKLIGVTDAAIPAIYLIALGFSLFCGMAVGALGAVRSGRRRLLWSVPFMPIYWLILFPPLIQALIELQIRPFHWHKTEHGVTGAPPSTAGD